MFGNVLRWHSCIFHWCVGITVHDEPNIITFGHTMHNVIYYVFVQAANELVCVSSSWSFVNFVFLLVKWLFWLVYELLL